MAKTGDSSHATITQNTKPHAMCARNLSVRMRKIYPGFKSLELSLWMERHAGDCVSAMLSNHLPQPSPLLIHALSYACNSPKITNE